MGIIKQDQHLANYVYEKQVNPDAKLVWKAYERRLVDAVDHIIELAHGQRDYVQTENDWKVVEELFVFFAKEWPNEYRDFKTAIPDIRSSRGEGGYSESREIKYVGAIPPRFAKMLKAIFPAQQWDKSFVSKFVKRLPIFKVGGA